MEPYLWPNILRNAARSGHAWLNAYDGPSDEQCRANGLDHARGSSTRHRNIESNERLELLQVEFLEESHRGGFNMFFAVGLVYLKRFQV